MDKETISHVNKILLRTAHHTTGEVQASSCDMNVSALMAWWWDRSVRRFHVSVQCPPFLSCPHCCCVNIRAARVILTLDAAKGRNTIYQSHIHTQLVDRSHGEESDAADQELGTSAGRERL